MKLKNIKKRIYILVSILISILIIATLIIGKEINKIDRRDRQLEYIQKVLKAISKLSDKDELEYIYYKYVKFLRNIEIDEMLNKSPRSRARLASKALFNMALLLNVEVYEGEDKA